MNNIMKKIIGLLIAMCIIIFVSSADPINTINNKHPQPKIKIKAIKDTIDTINDGTIEINVGNTWPTGLNVDISAIGPPEVYFFSEIFEDGAKGIAGGNFIVPPGQNRTIYILVRSDKIGKYSVQINGEYYTEMFSEDNIDSNRLQFTQLFKVNGKSQKVPEARYSLNNPFSTLNNIVDMIRELGINI